jgi:hypothetical protein
MMLKSTVQIRANVSIGIIDAKTGRFLKIIRLHNLVTATGLAAIAGTLAGGNALITHMGLGSSNTVASSGQTGLVTEIERPIITNVSSVGAVATAQYYLASNRLVGQNIREAGLFAGSVLIARIVFDDPRLQPKGNDTASVFSWSVTFAAL